MSFPLRIEYPGALYHVTSRGDGRPRIFTTGRDKGLFLQFRGDTVSHDKETEKNHGAVFKAKVALETVKG